jgi:hypothetical protein
MKPLVALLALSLAANAILYFSRPKPSASASSSPQTAAVEKSSSNSTQSPNASSSPSSPSSASTTSVSSSPHAALWEKLRSGDATIVAALRAAGWPEDAIRLLVESLVQDAYRDRFKALRPSSSVTEYWRQDAVFNRFNPEQRKASHELSREMRARLKQLLGPDYTPEQSWRDPRYARFTPAQAESLRLIEEDYNVLIAEARGNSSMVGRTILLPEDREKLRFLEAEKAADIAKVLSPSELLEYDLRHSQAASTLRNTFAGLRATEEEFRALLPLQKAMHEKIGVASGNTPADRTLRDQAQREMDAAAKAVLSPARYDEYIRAKDYEYGRLVTLSDRLQLPPTAAATAYDIKADIEKRSREIRPSGPDGMKAYQAARAELAAEAEKRLLDTLGQRGLDAYKINGAYWLTNLTPNTSAR